MLPSPSLANTTWFASTLAVCSSIHPSQPLSPPTLPSCVSVPPLSPLPSRGVVEPLFPALPSRLDGTGGNALSSNCTPSLRGVRGYTGSYVWKSHVDGRVLLSFYYRSANVLARLLYECIGVVVLRTFFLRQRQHRLVQVECRNITYPAANSYAVFFG